MTGYATVALFNYDSAGRRSSLTLGPGWTTSSVGYGYDGVGRLSSLTHDLAGTSADQSLGLTYNPASQVVGRSSTNEAYVWADAANVSRACAVNERAAAAPAFPTQCTSALVRAMF